jgi:transglutaminase-like putative cysteine protease
VAASGSPSPVVDDAGVVATAPLGQGARYAASAVVPGASTDAPSTDASPVPSLPGDVPPGVQSLATAITGGQSTPLDKAEALTDYFRSGRFHYTATPPAPAPGSDPLVDFLTRRTGSCEDFAGAFAVLARAAGLSTRVAVGFTPGRSIDGVTVVRGADAHAWPQVSIDGSWVSFEPTPQLPSGELSPPGVLGPSGLGRPNPTGTTTVPNVSLPTPTTPAVTAPPSSPPVPAALPPPGAGAPWGLVILGSAVAAGAILVALRLRRRTRLDRLVHSWQAIDRALARRGMPRPASSTPTGCLRGLSAGLDATGAPGRDGVAVMRDMATVATLLEQVTFGTAELTEEDADRAARASRRARRAVLSGALTTAGHVR